MPLAQAFIHYHPEAHRLATAVFNYNWHPGNLPLSMSRSVSIPSEFLDPLHNDPNLGPSFCHEEFESDCTNSSYFATAPIPAMNNQRQKMMYVESTTHMHPYHPVFPPPQHISLQFVDINWDQCILLTN